MSWLVHVGSQRPCAKQFFRYSSTLHSEHMQHGKPTVCRGTSSSKRPCSTQPCDVFVRVLHLDTPSNGSSGVRAERRTGPGCPGNVMKPFGSELSRCRCRRRAAKVAKRPASGATQALRARYSARKSGFCENLLFWPSISDNLLRSKTWENKRAPFLEEFQPCSNR